MSQVVKWLNNKQGKLKRAIAVAIVCDVLLLLPSCIPDLRKPAPAPPLPQSFKRGPDSPQNSGQLRVEEFYTDPMLLGLIDGALGGNQELRILSESVQIASNEVLSRRGTYLPLLTVGGGPSLTKVSSFVVEGAGIRDDPFRPGQFFPNPLPNYVMGANFFWQIDIWRQLRNARDAAVQRLIAVSQERNFFITRLVAEIAENYYTLMVLDARMANLDRIIDLQERSLVIARSRFQAARSSDLPVRRFQAEVRKNQSQKLIVTQDIIQAENRINFLMGRFPQRVVRTPVNFIELKLHDLSVGVPTQLLLNRPDIREAERQIAAAGLDVLVARARFLPVLTITSGVGYEGFNPRYMFLTPEGLIWNIAGGLVGPLINFKAIKADYLSANAQQLQTVYNYQRVIINAVVDVVNRMSKVQNYGISIDIKKQQVQALEAAVAAATFLYNNPRAEVAIDYLDVLTAQNELFAAIRDLIDTKGEQLAAIVNTYQALGGGSYLAPMNVPAAFKTDHWKHFLRREAGEIGEVSPGLVPPPAPGVGPPLPPSMVPVTEVGPPPKPVAETDPKAGAATPAENGVEPNPNRPSVGPPRPFSGPPAGNLPDALPAPAAANEPAAEKAGK